MTPQSDRSYTAFADSNRIASGQALDVALAVKKFQQSDREAQVLIFDDLTSHQLELDLRGSLEDVRHRMEDNLKPEIKTGPGRPKLGVVSKEVTLLPQHWEWLALQPGGASVTLRKLVDQARKKNHDKDLIRQAQDATYRFMTIMAGNLPDFEDALRALYADDLGKFKRLTSSWPKDIRTHARKLAAPCFRTA